LAGSARRRRGGCCWRGASGWQGAAVGCGDDGSWVACGGRAGRAGAARD
jgi:hypothetical protein